MSETSYKDGDQTSTAPGDAPASSSGEAPKSSLVEVTRRTTPDGSVIVVYDDYSWEVRLPDGTVLTSASSNVTVEYMAPRDHYALRGLRAIVFGGATTILTPASGGAPLVVKGVAFLAGTLGGEFAVSEIWPIADPGETTVSIYSNMSCEATGGYLGADGTMKNQVTWFIYDMVQIGIKKDYSVSVETKLGAREQVMRCSS